MIIQIEADATSLDGSNTEEGKAEKRILNFMDLVPVQAKEYIQKEWQVGFEQPRFKSSFWNRFFVFLGASENLVVRLDRMGSEIWGHIDGKNTVRQILVRLELRHPEDDNLRDRLVEYLKRLKLHEFIELGNEENVEEQI